MILDSTLSALAVVCCWALFVRAVNIVNEMNYRTRRIPYLQFLAYGLSHAGGLAVAVGCTLVIMSGTANVWAYILVYSAGGGVIFDRRKYKRCPP